LIAFRKLNFWGYQRWQKQWLARIILYGDSPPKSTTTLAQLYEDLLLVIYFGILILL